MTGKTHRSVASLVTGSCQLKADTQTFRLNITQGVRHTVFRLIMAQTGCTAQLYSSAEQKLTACRLT